MVPFSFPQPLLKSRVMNKYTSSSATVGVWAPGAWGLESDVFTLSCLPAFLIILIPAPVFPSFPSVFKNRGWFMAARRKAKLPNEPNFKMPFPQLNIDDFPFSLVFETCKKVSILCYFHAVSGRLWGSYRSKTSVQCLWSSVVKKWSPWCRSSAGVDHRPSR